MARLASLVRSVAPIGIFVLTGCAASGHSTTPSLKVGPQAALVGQWAQLGQKKPRIILRADSTFVVTAILSMGGQTQDLTGRWHVTGDTVVFTEPVVRVGANPVPGVDGNNALAQMGGPTRLFALEGRQLTLTRPTPGAKPVVYERLDASSP